MQRWHLRCATYLSPHMSKNKTDLTTSQLLRQGQISLFRFSKECVWHALLNQYRIHAHVVRRTAEGMSNKEIQRCLKRYVVREIYPLILMDLIAAAKIS